MGVHLGCHISERENPTLKHAWRSKGRAGSPLPAERRALSDAPYQGQTLEPCHWERFMTWRTITGKELVPPGSLQLETLLKGLTSAATRAGKMPLRQAGRVSRGLSRDGVHWPVRRFARCLALRKASEESCWFSVVAAELGIAPAGFGAGGVAGVA
jgi:hypothetical protein